MGLTTMSDHNRVTVTTEGPTPRGWPESMKVVASTTTAFGAIGHAVILEGRLPDFYRHHWPDAALAFGLRGSARIEWKRGGRLSRFVGAPGGFTIVPAGEENSFCMDRSLQTLNLVFGSHQLRALADREWKPYGPTIEIAPVYHQTAPEVVALGQAFAGLLRSPRNGSGLYAETLWTQIAIQVLWNYSSLPRQGEAWVERLPDARLRDLIGRSRRRGRPQPQLLPQRFQESDREDAPPLPDREARGQGLRAVEQPPTLHRQRGSRRRFLVAEPLHDRVRPLHENHPRLLPCAHSWSGAGTG